MKKFAKIYNIIISIIFIAVLVFSIIDVNEVEYKTELNKDNIYTHLDNLESRPIIDKEAKEAARDYIVNTIEGYGFVNQNVLGYSYLIQKTSSEKVDKNRETLETIVEGLDPQDSVAYHDFVLENIVVYLPANGPEKTNDAVMFMAHYDSVPMGPGSADDGSMVAVMLEAIRYYKIKLTKNEVVTNNDLVFVFTDGEEYGCLGSAKYVNDFTGFNNLVQRTKLGINLESRGSSGTAIMFETSQKNSKLIKLYKDLDQTPFVSSISNMVYQMMNNFTDFTSFASEIKGYNIANIGGGEHYHTQNDNKENLPKSYISQAANIVTSTVEATKDYNLNELYLTDDDVVYFSYLNLGTISYSKGFAYVLNSLLLLLFIALIIITIYRKQTNYKDTIKSIAVIVGSLFFVVLAIFVLYYVSAFIAALFGTVNFHRISNITYNNNLITILLILMTALFAAVAIAKGATWFKLERKSLRKGLTYVITFIAVLINIFLPMVSYLFAYLAMFMIIRELLEELFPKLDSFNIRFSLTILTLTIPLVVPVIFLAVSALGIKSAYLVSVIISIYALVFIVSNLDKFKYLDTFYFMNRRRKKNLVLDRTRGVYCTIMKVVIVLIITLAIPVHLSDNVSSSQKYVMYPYDDAVVYLKTEEGLRAEIRDLDAYQSLNKELDGFRYREGVYKKALENQDFTKLANVKLIGNQLQITKSSETTYVEIIVSNNKNITGYFYEIDGITFARRFEAVEERFVLRFSENTVVTFEILEEAALDANLTSYELAVNHQELMAFEEKLLLADAKYKNARFNLIYKKEIR